jgi:uncharacterized protein
MLKLEYARALYEGSDSVHDFDHVLRVLALGRRIAQAEGADMVIVETAILLHDIDRADPEVARSGADHGVLAAERARAILADLPNPPRPEFIDAVVHAIEAHRFRNAIEPETLEAKVVFDADKLDAIGAIGIARAYAYGAILGQRLWGEVPPDYDQEGPDHTAHHEFVYKLARIQDRLYTRSGRAIAQERHAYMSAFFDRLAREIRGDL